MFAEFLDLPLHPLAVHAPVVLVPLLLLAALAYALVPKVRTYVGWLAALLAVAAPISAVLAKLSGDEYRATLYGPQVLPVDHAVEVHSRFGNSLMWSSLGLGVVTLGLYLLRRRADTVTGARRVAIWVVTGLVVVLAAATAYYTFRVGHSGAEMTHGGRIPS